MKLKERSLPTGHVAGRFVLPVQVSLLAAVSDRTGIIETWDLLVIVDQVKGIERADQ